MTFPVATPAGSVGTEAMDGGRHASCTAAEGKDEVTELSCAGTRGGARMMGVPAGIDAVGNTVGIAAAPTGVGDRNLVLPSAIPVNELTRI